MPATLVPFPDTARVDVPPALAAALLRAAEALPPYENKQFYDVDLQAHIHQQVRGAAPRPFDELIDDVKRRLAKRPYSALLRGLRFDEGNRVFVAVNKALGTLVARPYEKPRAQLVHYIQPSTDRPAARGTHYESERLHTDTADWSPPVELISMLCVRADTEGGGRSRVLDIDSLREQVRSRMGPDALNTLATVPVPWQLAPCHGGGVQWLPVLSDSSICWRRYTIDLAVDNAGAKVPESVAELLDAFEDVVCSADGTLDLLMREGELLIIDNLRTIHARTSIPAGIESNRLMIRSWVRTSDPSAEPNKEAGRA